MTKAEIKKLFVAIEKHDQDSVLGILAKDKAQSKQLGTITLIAETRLL